MTSRLILLRSPVANNLKSNSSPFRCLHYQSRLLSKISNGGASVRRQVSKEERVALRAARRERAAQMLQQGAESSEGGTAVASAAAVGGKQMLSSRWIWYLGMGIPSVLLVWGLNDENSPPAKVSEFIGLTALITSYTDQIAKPTHEKLLPDWSQVSASSCN